MCEAVTEFVTAVRFAAQASADRPPVTQTTDEYEDAYKLWETRRAALGTKLEAYFPRSKYSPQRNVKRDWRCFVEYMKRFYELIRNQDTGEDHANDLPDTTINLLTKYRQDRRQHDRNRAPTDSFRRIPIEASDTFEQIEEELERPIYDCKGELIDRIMEWRLEGLEGQPPIFKRGLSWIR
jgi:hypothetical protein